jgi:hypothetical protein
MDLATWWTWLSAMFLLGLASMGLCLLFLKGCENI